MMDAVVNHMPPPNPIDPAIPSSSSLVITPDPVVESMTKKEVKSKIKSLENQIKPTKETHTKSVCFSDLCLHPKLGYPTQFRAPD